MSKPTKASANGTKLTKRVAEKKAVPKKPTKQTRRELTAEEAFMRAWEYSYKNRHKRVA
jgi:hemerythrin